MSKPTRQNHFAKRSLGQNFLADPNSIRKIIDSLELSVNDTVVEIGPGRGALTEQLVASGANVIAIELDRELVRMLREKFGEDDNILIVEANVLEVDLGSLLNETSHVAIHSPHSAKLVGNLPYYISTSILQKLIRERQLFSRLVLMFQKEVVERITARPGTSERGYLSVLAQSAFEIERLFDVSPGSFRPAPKVWSSVVRFFPKNVGPLDDERSLRLLSAAFAQKRKTILNNLKAFSPDAGTALADAGLDPKRRAESLTLEEWGSLFSSFAR